MAVVRPVGSCMVSISCEDSVGGPNLLVVARCTCCVCREYSPLAVACVSKSGLLGRMLTCVCERTEYRCCSSSIVFCGPCGPVCGWTSGRGGCRVRRLSKSFCFHCSIRWESPSATKLSSGS
jgi:hypothetical protein